MGFIGRMMEDPYTRRHLDIWERKQAVKDHRADQRHAASMRQKAIAEKKRADEAKRKELIATYREQEKSHYGQPQTDYFGGNNTSRDTIWIQHFASDLPLAGLPHPDDREYAANPVWFGPGLQRERNGNLASNAAWMTKARATKAIWDDGVKERYTPILSKIRDEKFWRELTSDVHRVEKPVDVAYQATYSIVTYKLTKVHVPTIKSVRVAEGGLRIVVRRDGGAARDWTAKLDYIRAGFKSGGMDARNLRVTETIDGDIELRFEDAPSSFPLAVAPPVTTPVRSSAEARAKYKDFRWNLGVDSRGTVIAPSIREVFHVLAIGGTGSGKSVWLRGLIESARLSGFRVYLGDGKMSDYPALENAHGVVMRSSDAAQHVVLVAEFHAEIERRQAVAEQRKREGHPNSFDFDPCLLVLDEFASMRSDVLALCGGKKTAMQPWLDQIAAIARKGRELKMHLVLASQDLYVENIPNQWQANFQLLVSLGEIEDKTLDTKFIPDTMTEEAKRVGSRITRKDRGRGLFVDKSEPTHIKIVEFQSFYSYSPGSTSLAEGAPADVAPPTPEVRAVWEQQLVAAEQMPRLYSRVGIKVEGPDWTKLPVDSLSEVPTVALDDGDGNPIPALVRYDQRSGEWLGRKKFSMTTRRGSSSTAPEPAPEPDPQQAEDPSPRRLTPEEVRAEAIRLGYIKPDDAEPAPAKPDIVNETPTDTTKPDEDAAPPHSTTWGDF